MSVVAGQRYLCIVMLIHLFLQASHICVSRVSYTCFCRPAITVHREAHTRVVAGQRYLCIARLIRVMLQASHICVS
jgi:hypothetical protein